MGIMGKLKQAAKGRSAMVEKGIDRAVGEVDKRTSGKYHDKLSQGAKGIKDRARQLDADRTDPPADGPNPGSTPPPV